MCTAFFAFTLTLSVLGATQPFPKPDAVVLARQTVDRLTKGDFAAVIATFDERMAAGLPEQKRRDTWKSIESQFGALKQVGEPRLSNKGEYQIVVIPAAFERASVDLQIVFDAAGRTAGLSVRPGAPTGPSTDAPSIRASVRTNPSATWRAGSHREVWRCCTADATTR